MLLVVVSVGERKMCCGLAPGLVAEAPHGPCLPVVLRTFLQTSFTEAAIRACRRISGRMILAIGKTAVPRRYCTPTQSMRPLLMVGRSDKDWL